jgi:hypothetical protein
LDSSEFTSITELCEIGGLGFQSHRDNFVVALSSHDLTKRMKEFFDLSLSDKEVKDRFEIEDYRRFVVGQFRRENKFENSAIRRIQYRPFDYRYIYYARDIVQEWQIRFHGHLLKPNLGLNVMRQTKSPSWHHVMVSSTPTPAVFVEIKDGSSQFPLYRYSDFEESLFTAKEGRVPNLNARLIKEWFVRMQIRPSWLSDKSIAADTATPEDVFRYAYAVFHCPTYRSRYAEFLKIDFPCLPLTGNLELFRELGRLGGELVAPHLMESPKLDHFITTYTGPKNPEVGRVGWSDNTIWLDAAATKKGQPATPGTIGFRGVPKTVWNFHIGGYQVCEKWLKDRKGRNLSAEDIAHYQKIIVALAETIRLMEEIDQVIEVHGGWPGAFVTSRVELSEVPARPGAAEQKDQVPYFSEEPDSLPLTEKVAERKDDSEPGNSGFEDQNSEDERRNIYDTTREEGIAAIREIFSASDKPEGMDRETAIRAVAKLMGFDRLGPRIREFIDGDLTAAAHRGIIKTEQGILRLNSRSIDDYSRDSLKGFLLSVMGTTWWDQDDAIRAAARHLGFRRTGSAIQEAFKSAINGAIRQGLIEREGSNIRKVS